MEDMNVTFCRSVLRTAREEIKKQKIKVGKLITWKDTASYNTYFEVWIGSKIVWQGTADNAYEAKANYLFTLIKD